MILDFGEATRMKSYFKRKYNTHHNHIYPNMVLREKAEHAVESDIVSFGIILKNLATIIEGQEDVELVQAVAGHCGSFLILVNTYLF